MKNKLDVIELWKLITKVHANGDSSINIFNIIVALKAYVGIAQKPCCRLQSQLNERAGVMTLR